LTPEQLRVLRDALTEFSAAEAPAPLLREFCRYYGIEFGALQPAPEYRAGTVRSGPYALMAHRWLRPGASRNLLLVHGYFDHSGLYGKLVEYGLSRNCNVLIFDLPGHGLSSGEAAAIDDFGYYGRAIADVLSAVRMPSLPLWVMAQSTGCAALVEYARGHAWPFSKVVLMAPLVRPVGWFRVRVAHAVIHRFVDSVAREFSENSSDRQFLAFVRSDPLQARRISLRWVGALKRWLACLPVQDLGVGPSLVLQGEADATVAWRYNLRIIEKLFPGSRIEPLAGAGHHLANEADEFRQRYYRLVDRYLGVDQPNSS
jgi:alpha-beta hydrolase superfamily lysophospholipase